MTTNNNYPWLIKFLANTTAWIFICAIITASGIRANAQPVAKINNLTNQKPATGQKVKVRLRGGQMKTQIEDGKMVLTGFNGAFAGGVVNMAGRIDAAGRGAQSADLTLKSVDLGQVLNLAPGAQVSFLKGIRVSGLAKATWEGEDVLRIGQNLTGKFALTLGSGQLTDPALLAKLAKATGIQQLDPIAYTNGKIEGTATAGHLKFTNVELSGPEFKLAAKGEVDVRADDLDLAFQVDVAQELAQQSTLLQLNNVLSFFKGKATKSETNGFVKLPEFALVGSLKAPEFKLGGGTEVASPESPVQANPVAAAGEKEPAPAGGIASARKTFAALLKK